MTQQNDKTTQTETGSSCCGYDVCDLLGNSMDIGEVGYCQECGEYATLEVI